MADKRELLFDFKAKEDVSAKAKKAGDAIEDLGKDFEKTTASAKGLDKQADKTGSVIDDMGEDFKKTTTAAERFDAKLADTENEIKNLAEEIHRTGDLDLFKKLNAKKRDLKKMITIKDLLPGDGEGKSEALSIGKKLAGNVAEGLMKAGSGISSALGSVVGTLPPQAQAAIGVAVIAAVATAAPLAGAALAGGLAVGLAGGVVAAGVMLAFQDPGIKAAAAALGSEIKTDLSRAASGFKAPIKATLVGLRGDFKAVLPDIQATFKTAAGYVKPLAAGVGGFVRNVMPGIKGIVGAAGPAIKAVSMGLKGIGKVVGDVLSSLSDNGREMGAGLLIVFTLIAGSIKIFGVVLNFAVEQFGHLLDVALSFSDWLAGIAEKMQGMPGPIGEMASKFVGFNQQLQNGNTHWKNFGDAAEEGLGVARDATQSLGSDLDEVATKLRAQYDPTFALIDAQHGLRDAQKEYNEAVSEHGKKSPEAQAALLKSAEAAIALDAAIGGAAGTFDGKLSPSMVATLKAAKFTDAEIATLEQQFKNAKAAGDKFAKNYQATVGLTDKAYAKAKAISDVVNGIKSKDITIGVWWQSNGDLKVPGGTQKKADGGPVRGPGPKGVDSVPHILAPGEYVLNDNDVDAMGGFAGVEKMRAGLRGGKTASPRMPASGGGSGGGGTSIVINNLALPGVQDVAGFVEELRKFVRVNGRGNVQVAFGGR